MHIWLIIIRFYRLSKTISLAGGLSSCSWMIEKQAKLKHAYIQRLFIPIYLFECLPRFDSDSKDQILQLVQA
jgi:hypothetical protein